MFKRIFKNFSKKTNNKSESDKKSNTFSKYEDVFKKNPSAFTVSTKVEVKDKDGKIYKGTFAAAFKQKTFNLVLDDNKEKTFNNDDVQIKIIEKPSLITGMRGGKTKRKNKSITKKNHKKN
jgi:small nuclear ribonucleoprotein (snRNP)-like protein